MAEEAARSTSTFLGFLIHVSLGKHSLLLRSPHQHNCRIFLSLPWQRSRASIPHLTRHLDQFSCVDWTCSDETAGVNHEILCSTRHSTVDFLNGTSTNGLGCWKHHDFTERNSHGIDHGQSRNAWEEVHEDHHWHRTALSLWLHDVLCLWNAAASLLLLSAGKNQAMLDFWTFLNFFALVAFWCRLSGRNLAQCHSICDEKWPLDYLNSCAGNHFSLHVLNHWLYFLQRWLLGASWQGFSW